MAHEVRYGHLAREDECDWSSKQTDQHQSPSDHFENRRESDERGERDGASARNDRPGECEPLGGAKLEKQKRGCDPQCAEHVRSGVPPTGSNYRDVHTRFLPPTAFPMHWAGVLNETDMARLELLVFNCRWLSGGGPIRSRHLLSDRITVGRTALERPSCALTKRGRALTHAHCATATIQKGLTEDSQYEKSHCGM
jgi:hypothetical protein